MHTRDRNENGLQVKNPPSDDGIKLNLGFGIWFLKCIVITIFLAFINHLLFLIDFYISIVLNAYVKENKFELMDTTQNT